MSTCFKAETRYLPPLSCMESQGSVNNDEEGNGGKAKVRGLGLFRDFRNFSVGEIQAWVSWKWLTKAPIEVERLSRNVFIFYCHSGEDRDKLVALSTACYKGALMVFKKWTPNSSLMDYDFSWGTLWIKIEGLPLHINQVRVAADLLERFGSVVYFDGKSKTEGPQKTVRARVRTHLNGALIPGCFLELEQGKVKWVSFRYEGVFVFACIVGE
ncbi:50S ribosomal protein L22 [Bienertia sinuspersici]